ncbi:hypothetical protein GF324_10050, partial [bacterium]|nr:hypothetical protein [bacterium]
MPLTIHEYLPDDLQEHIREEVARGGLKTAVSLRTTSGWKTVDSPYEPRGEAKRICRDVRAGDRVLVLGSGSGYVAEELIEIGVKGVLLVTGSRTLAEKHTRRLESHGNFDADITVAAGRDADRLFEEYIRPWMEPGDVKVLLHPREGRAFPGLFTALGVRVEFQRRGRACRQHHGPMQRVLFPTSGGLLEPETSEAFHELGVDVIETDTLAGKPLDVRSALDLLEKHRPDLVFSTDNQGGDSRAFLPEACERCGIPWASWFLDDPRFVLTTEQVDGQAPERFGFMWDANGLDGWRELGLSHAELLPLATDPKRFFPGEGDTTLQSRPVFVGSPMFARARGYFAALEGDKRAEAVAEALGDEIRRTRRPPTDRQVEEVLDSLGFAGAFEGDSRRRLPAFAIQRENFRYRRDLLTALAPLRP